MLNFSASIIPTVARLEAPHDEADGVPRAISALVSCLGRYHHVRCSTGVTPMQNALLGEMDMWGTEATASTGVSPSICVVADRVLVDIARVAMGATKG